MKNCEACRVHVDTLQDQFCPLCGEELITIDLATPSKHPYPNLAGRLQKYNFIARLLLFLTLLGCAVSVLINWLVTPDFWWCLIVLAAAAYCWVSIPPLLRRGANFATRAVWQVIFTSLLCVILDWIVGYTGWSVTYVLPSLLCAGILSITLMAVFSRTSWVQYVFSLSWMALFAFIPLILYLLDIAQNLVMVLITAALGIACLLTLIVFGDRTIKNEFRRRFHL